MRYTTADGSTVTVTPISSCLIDVHVQNAAGESVATVRRPRVEIMTILRAGQSLGNVTR
ncbi:MULTISPECIES: hypothetical protein [unclassified Kitasatospora]|uniref:hypothetical protein n=1 Tax=unclassified Kitasatospora TaxID=2633591 RepID=UPI002475180A|nr:MULTISPECIES: hypothetical protein [unclassified Kitasatospora]MDH6123832.1 hypothetical protein [Kitasatospora sp. GP82]MDH6576069.1 hypothetical protein [Kitasatospora sp. MAP5-34]